jgi:CBS domain-containing protein
MQRKPRANASRNVRDAIASTALTVRGSSFGRGAASARFLVGESRPSGLLGFEPTSSGTSAASQLQETSQERALEIADLMSRNVATCSPDDRLDVPAKLMWDLDIGCVVVINSGRRVVGILTDRDVCMATYTQGKAPQHVFVRETMAHEVFSCLPDDSLAEAEEIMRRHRVRRLPVVELDGRLVGILSLNDLARESARQQTRIQKDLTPADVSSTLAAICQPRHPAVLPPSA